MWYFSWVLGVCLAAGCGILNAMWFEMNSSDCKKRTLDEN